MLIRKLLSHERPLFADHLKRLPPRDRGFRFAHPRVDDAWIDRYVSGIAADDLILGGFEDDRLVAAVHVAFADEIAEVGVSVDHDQRGKGVGTDLFNRAIRWARNRRAERLYTLCQADNTGMLALADKLGMAIHRESGTAEAFLALPPPDLLTVSDELSAGFNVVFHDWAEMVLSYQSLLLPKPAAR